MDIVFFLVQRCNDIPPLHRGTATCTGSEFQDSCTFHCDRGYERIGSEKKVCQANGQWTGSDVVKCEGKVYTNFRLYFHVMHTYSFLLHPIPPIITLTSRVMPNLIWL
jgi:hypothetical protein